MADNVCAYCGAPAGRVSFVGVLRVPHCHSAACEAAVESDGDAVVELSLRWSTRTRRRPSAQVEYKPGEKGEKTAMPDKVREALAKLRGR